MARFTASTAFNIDTLNLSAYFAGSENTYDPTNVNIGLKTYDGRLLSTDAVAPRGQLIAFLEDETFITVDDEIVMTGGTIGNLQFNVGFGATGWSPSFRISSIDASIVDAVSMLATADVADDRAYFTNLFTGDDTINLSLYADRMEAGLGDDWMGGNNGNDTLLGDGGDDTIDGGLGNDNIQGNTEADNVNGGRGLDTVNGGVGNDIVRGGAGMDTMIGGGDVDIFDFKRGDGHDFVADYNDTQDWFRVDVVDTAAPGMVKVQDGANVVVTFTGVAGFSITIANQDVDNIWNNDFIYV